MSWALIRTSDNAWLSGPLEEEPAPAAGEYVVVVALGFPDTCRWDEATGGFVDIVADAPLISVGRFKLLLTYDERAAIRAAAATEDQIADFLDLLAGFTDGVALSDPVLVASINALVPAGLITATRAAEILAGAPPPPTD
ncbi:MAG: hypothetical protein DI623_03075 [Sphingomonas sanxanigenens]|uniref:Uncharacterized protein n=1 Tax=Sphingomonas sanxanigenens TaxID=397260 RepID=A0A2W5CB06_9SPHN|nr:MAG: hypothetical protein DI623_03075 [Sphingomonas sanxanigenens]